MTADTRRPWRVTRTVVSGLTSIPLIAGLIVSTQPAAAQDRETDTSTTVEPQVQQELAAEGSAEFLVYLRDQADLHEAAGIANRSDKGRFVHEKLTQTAKGSQGSLRKLLNSAGADYQSFWIANTVKVTGDAKLLDRISTLPEVSQITADRVYEMPEPLPAEEQPGVESVEWGLDRINAPHVWSEYGVDGADIVVGTIDTGVKFDHPALVGQYRGSLGDGEFDHNYNWWDPSSVCGSPSVAPCDDVGHGTHVTGTVAGDDGDGNQIGVAPGAKWIAAKGCASQGCSASALLSAAQFMLAPTDLQGNNANPDLRPHIVNNSWGGAATTDPWFQPTVQAWEAAGIFPMFSSGNTDGSAACGSASNPGNLPETYSAGAFDVNNAIAPFSNRGPSAWDGLVKPNISAPGVAIRSAWADGSYRSISGTSMASPHVAGTVALMWSAAPTLARDISATRELLDRTAIDTEDLSCGGTAENNNIWGQGRLDALAAVDASPHGPKGALNGTVTDAETGDPIAGVTVAIGEDVKRLRVTDDSGRYSFGHLPVGTYPVDVTTYGYAGQDATVTITADNTTTQDLALEPVPAVTVSGRIADGTSHGWPLWADVVVNDTPVSTVTDQTTGEYELEVPVGGTYDVSVQSRYPGYADTEITVDTEDGDVTADLALPVAQCLDAPGYHVDASVGILGEFTGNYGAPLGEFIRDHGVSSTEITWGDDVADFDTIVVNKPDRPSEEQFLDFLDATDTAGVGVVFLDVFWTPSGISLLNQHLENPATRTRDGHATIPEVYYEVAEQHPVLEGFDIGDQLVMVDETSQSNDYAYFGGYEGDGRMVIARAGNGRDGIQGDGIGVQQRDHNRHVLLSMHGADSSRTGPPRWNDDASRVFVNALEWTAETSLDCLPIDGGLVIGDVTDQNTGDPLQRTTVSDVESPDQAGTSAEDGSYWMFSSATGERDLVATHGRYNDDTTTVDVVPDAITRADFTMSAGRLSVEPADVTASVRLGRSDEQVLTVANTGTAPATVELGGEQYESFEPLDGATTSAEAASVANRVREVHGEFSPALTDTVKEPKPAGEDQAIAPEQSAPAAAPWERITDLPTTVNGNGAGAVDGIVYSFGGIRGFSAQVAMHAYDPETGEWTRRADMPESRQGPGAATIDSQMYVAGGYHTWGSERPGYQRTLYVYDPETDTWSRRADMPTGRAGMATAELNGRLYVVAGCTGPGSACEPSDDVYAYDPADDEWEELADYPEPTSWQACGGLSGRLYCTGGTANASTSSSTYAYDPASDTWTAVTGLPYDNWGMSYTTSGGRLVVSGGVTDGGAAVTNRGSAYDPTTDSWTAIEPSNLLTYRSASACGFYKVAGRVASVFPYVPWVDRHPGFENCEGTSDAPWLAVESSDATTIEPGEEITIKVAMDSAAAEEQYPGTHTSGIWFRHDTPYAVDPVEVTLDVTPPGNWGKISGTITGVSCEGDEASVDGAAVTIDGRKQEVTLVADDDGGYTYWLPAQRLDVVAAADGYYPQRRTVIVRPNKTAAGDIKLQAVCSKLPQ